MIKNYFKLIVALVFVSNVMAQNVPSYVPTNGLVGWWPFNGNANDESGNGNNGIVNGATLTSDRNGKSNSAYSFNGNASINLGNSSLFKFNSESEFSLSTWVNIENLDGGWRAILVKGCWDYGIYNRSDIFMIGHHSLEYGGQPINKWIFVTYNNKSGTAHLYVNGLLISSAPSSFGSSDGILSIGQKGDCAYDFFKGKIDDIAIYNRALTQQEITALYTGTPVAQNIPSYVPKNGLVGYWPFNGNANDESGNGNNGTVNGATLTEDRNGATNSAYQFGTNKSINIPNFKLSSDIGYALSLWYKSDETYTGSSVLRKESGCDFPDFLVQITKDSVQAGIRTVDEGWVYQKQGDFKSGVIFHHLLVNYDLNYLSLYVDNKLIIKTPKKSKVTDLENIIYLGMCGGYGDFFSGKIDDIAIYNRALTQQEITALYTGNTQSALASTKVFVDAPATVNQNQEVELSISTEALNTSDNVIAYQTDFSYDTTRYTYVGNNLTGTLNPSGNAVVNSAKNGKLAISYMSQTALSGAGSLVNLKFKANNTLGQGVFGLSNFLYNTTSVTSLKSDTVNTIDGIPPTARITYSQNPVRKGDSLLITVNFNEKMAVSPVPQLNLTGQNNLANTNLTKVNDTTYTYWWVVEKGNGAVNVNLATGKDLGGNVIVATPTQNPSFTVLPTLFGDIDTNKLVQAYDAALALQYSVGLNPLPTMDPLPWSNWRLAVANVDTVGNVTANDASLILQHSAKLITTFPADAKKRGGDAPTANVTVTQEGNQLVFRATGTLYAFNVFMKDNFNVFGQPEVKDKSAMVASNINTTTYNVGLASTKPFIENEPFLVIPILTNDIVQGTMDIVANTEEKSLIYGKAAGIASINKEVVLVYPNPTKDVVTINNAQGKTLRIVDVQGKEVYNQKVNASSMEVSMKAIATRGEYIFQLINENNSIESTQKIILQ